ncbi:hypothetical protein [Caldiplasma sukawensis]
MAASGRGGKSAEAILGAERKLGTIFAYDRDAGLTILLGGLVTLGVAIYIFVETGIEGLYSDILNTILIVFSGLLMGIIEILSAILIFKNGKILEKNDNGISVISKEKYYSIAGRMKFFGFLALIASVLSLPSGYGGYIAGFILAMMGGAQAMISKKKYNLKRIE